jgi:glutathione S-transferase
MKLYVTYASPYARLARILVAEKVLQDRVKIIEAKTRTPGSLYYQINPSGRVPYLIDDAGIGMEDSQLICAYLDRLDGKPRFHDARGGNPDWVYLRLEAAARSLCDGISVWSREMHRPETERSPTVLVPRIVGRRAATDVNK